MQPLQPKAPKEVTTKKLDVVLQDHAAGQAWEPQLQSPMGTDFGFSTLDVSVKAPV